MNRPLKFRAWTGATMEYKVMAGYLGAFYCAGIDPADSACLSPANTIYGEETPIMQFTGFWDKNGKEIWESDIIRYFTNSVYPVVDVVFFDEKAACFGPTVEDVSVLGENCEVIGNIHENPELLS